jgi:hypothetical protein
MTSGIQHTLSTGKQIEVTDPALIEELNPPETQEQILARCKEDRRIAKEKMLARNAKRIEELKAAGKLKDVETLEQYDTRVATEK